MASEVRASRRFEFDAALRLPDHPGKRRRLHGHHYSVEVTLELAGRLPVQTDSGMVVDFDELGRTMGTWLADNVDHVAILAGNPEAVPGTFDASEIDLAGAIERTAGPASVVACPLGPPTAENLAEWLFNELRLVVSTRRGATLGEAFRFPSVALTRLRLYETPDCWVTVERE